MNRSIGNENECVHLLHKAGVVNKRNLHEFPADWFSFMISYEYAVIWFFGIHIISYDSHLSILFYRCSVADCDLEFIIFKHSGWQDESLNLSLHMIEARWRNNWNQFIIDKLRCVWIYCPEQKSNVGKWNWNEFC